MRNPLSSTLRGWVTLKFCLPASLALIILSSVPATAQDTLTGAFEGIISDSQTGAAIEGATIHIINKQTGLDIQKTTDSRGRDWLSSPRSGPTPENHLYRRSCSRSRRVRSLAGCCGHDPNAAATTHG